VYLSMSDCTQDCMKRGEISWRPAGHRRPEPEARVRLQVKRSIGALTETLIVATAMILPLWLERTGGTLLGEAHVKCVASYQACAAMQRFDLALPDVVLGDLAAVWHDRIVTLTNARVSPRRGGLEARVLDVAVAERVKPPRPSTTDASETHTSGSSGNGSRPLDDMRELLGHLPLSLHVRDPITMAAALGQTLTLTHASVAVDAHNVTARFDATLMARDASEMRFEDIEWVGELGSLEQVSSLRWIASGSVRVPNTQPLSMRIEGGSEGVLFTARSRTAHVRGWLDLDTTDIYPRALALAVRGLPAELLFPLRERIPPSMRLDVTGAIIDGTFELERAGSRWQVRANAAQVSSVTVQAPAIAREPMMFGPLSLDATLDIDRSVISGRLTLTHGRARIDVRGDYRSGHVDVSADLEETDCQALLEALPEGFAPVLRGMTLSGKVGGHLRVQSSEVEFPHPHQQDRSAVDGDPEDGSIVVDLPFLERCRIEDDAPGVDMRALAGTYQHRFVGDSGAEHLRVLAPGARDFIPLWRAQLIARAFVTLEDGRFFEHDGFDRAQMVRAFWHNLEQRRWSRGASTITQQTARNLFLGLDRSLGRKLQEAVLASRMEAMLSKNRILELYLNVIELGPDVHGIAQAARYHFGKEAHQLGVLEAVYLASLAPAPYALSQKFANGHVSPEWLAHLHEQVRRMNRHHWISREQATRALSERLVLVDHSIKPPS